MQNPPGSGSNRQFRRSRKLGESERRSRATAPRTQQSVERLGSGPIEPGAPAARGNERVNDAVSWHIDKSALALSEPRRYRDREHLKFVSTQRCLMCGRRPADAHHLRFMQPQALGRRVSDEFVVPLCRTHHRALHRRGDEPAWWAERNLDPVVLAANSGNGSRLTNGALVQHGLGATSVDEEAIDRMIWRHWQTPQRSESAGISC